MKHKIWWNSLDKKLVIIKCWNNLTWLTWWCNKWIIKVDVIKGY